MGDFNDRDLGDVITDIVEDVVGSGEFERLNSCIRDSIDAVFEELGMGTGGSWGAGDWASGARKSSYGEAAGKWAGGSAPSSSGAPRAPYERKSWATVLQEAMEAREKKLYTDNPAGQLSGTLYTWAGNFLMWFNGLVGIFGTVTSLVDADFSGVAVGLVSLAIAYGGFRLRKKGKEIRERIKRFKTYVRVIGERKYCTLKELAAAVKKTEDFVADDLRAMFDLKYFPKGRIDMQETTLMLDDESYNQYLNANQSYMERQAREKAEAKEKKEKEKKEKEKKESASAEGKKEESIFATPRQDAELQKAIREGEEYIRKIREANDAIPGEEITRKLDRLEDLMRKIFTVLSQKPDQLPKLRKFMQYYMPTTDKLVQTYRQLEAQSVEGEHISKAKKDIEDTLDTINDAYAKLLDNFFEEAAMDVSTDISVLQGLMAQEGLTAQPFGMK